MRQGEEGISREAQDAFAVESYGRVTKAWDEGKFQAEVVPVSVPQSRGDDLMVDCDEEYRNVKLTRFLPCVPPLTVRARSLRQTLLP